MRLALVPKERLRHLREPTTGFLAQKAVWVQLEALGPLVLSVWVWLEASVRRAQLRRGVRDDRAGAALGLRVALAFQPRTPAWFLALRLRLATSLFRSPHLARRPGHSTHPQEPAAWASSG